MIYSIPLKQHIGAPCKSIVSIGDMIKKGSIIAVPEGLGAVIHSPFYGKINDITNTSILIDAEDEQPDDYVPITAQSEKEKLKAAGIVGMGGAGFPTSVKLDIDLNGGYLLVNAAECEPLLHHNIEQLETRPEITLRGIKAIMKLCNAKKGVIALKVKNEKVIKILDSQLEKESDISYHLLPDLYPMGEERAVVREVLGTLLEPTQLPSAANAVVINVETVLRVAEALEFSKPCITKNITVAGKLNGGTHSRVFMDVPIGTTVGELIERAGGIDGDYGEIIMGGPFTGIPVTPDMPITKTTGGIIVTKPFENLNGRNVGLLLCACGGNEVRMRDIANKMNGTVIAIEKCKQAVDIKGTLKCENPGNCPGQASKCLNLKKAGCEDIIIGNCSDCTNTVMGSAPKLDLTVHHQTDHVFETVGLSVMRYLNKSKKVEIGSPSSPTIEAEKKADSTLSYHYEQTITNGILRIDIKEGKNIHIELPWK